MRYAGQSKAKQSKGPVVLSSCKGGLERCLSSSLRRRHLRVQHNALFCLLSAQAKEVLLEL